jgi:hypothetical protein
LSATASSSNIFFDLLRQTNNDGKKDFDAHHPITPHPYQFITNTGTNFGTGTID